MPVDPQRDLKARVRIRMAARSSDHVGCAVEQAAVGNSGHESHGVLNDVLKASCGQGGRRCCSGCGVSPRLLVQRFSAISASSSSRCGVPFREQMHSSRLQEVCVVERGHGSMRERMCSVYVKVSWSRGLMALPRNLPSRCVRGRERSLSPNRRPGRRGAATSGEEGDRV